MMTDLRGLFPALSKSGYRWTSPPTPDYNCVAWAVNDTKKWWEPDPFGFCFWPLGIARTYAIENYVRLCEQHGYAVCLTEELESGFEKIAIYTSINGFRHIARQLSDGNWTSKLGAQDDISHALNGVEGTEYGKATIFLKRQLKP